MPLDKDAYKRIFEGNQDGIAILDELCRVFAKDCYVKGGRAAERQTLVNCGERNVVEFIVKKINQANGVDQDE